MEEEFKRQHQAIVKSVQQKILREEELWPKNNIKDKKYEDKLIDIASTIVENSKEGAA
jgi:hypothetical protein